VECTFGTAFLKRLVYIKKVRILGRFGLFYEFENSTFRVIIFDVCLWAFLVHGICAGDNHKGIYAKITFLAIVISDGERWIF